MEAVLKKHKKTKTGVVLSDKMDKTITVVVERLVLHPYFKKYHKRRTKFKAHDEKNQCRVGDTVEIIETRPLSKTKRWSVRKVLERSAL
ncbi:MAG: 30S ribosomal protein S17 [Deltaproteobacteria bacterium]|nr:30S ribosomal protein S17 [Deltaproteobacteria bacterium]